MKTHEGEFSWVQIKGPPGGVFTLPASILSKGPKGGQKGTEGAFGGAALLTKLTS